MLIGLQLVGLNSKPGRSTVTICELFDLGGDAFDEHRDRVAGDRDRGGVRVDFDARATTTLPRLKGPATAGVTTSIPNGAPS